MPTIKRYSNRKLYDLDASRYVTLDDLAEMVRRGEELKVIDYATHADLTALTLTQIIFEQEKKLGGLLPQAILTRMLRVGNTTIQSLRGGVNAFLDPVVYAEEEIRRRLNLLVEEGTLLAEEAKHMGELLLAVRMRPTPPTPPPPAESAAPVEVEGLREQVSRLERELEALQSAQQK
jgi:polyhydroxyalkanoate synthesis repressor PhaR